MHGRHATIFNGVEDDDAVLKGVILVAVSASRKLKRDGAVLHSRFKQMGRAAR